MEGRELTEREAALLRLPNRMQVHPFEEIVWFEGTDEQGEPDGRDEHEEGGRVALLGQSGVERADCQPGASIGP